MKLFRTNGLNIMDKDNNAIKLFISFMMNNKNLTPKQRKLRDELLARDYRLLANEEDTTQREQLDTAETHEVPGNESLQGTEYNSPAMLHDFLYGFNQDPFLKYTSHLIDSQETIDEINAACKTTQYDFVKHAALLEHRLKDLIKKLEIKYPEVWKSFMVARAIHYVYGGKGTGSTWGLDKVESNWHDASIMAWAQQNPGIIPNPGKNIVKLQKSIGYKLAKPFRSSITGKRVSTFSDLVFYYKSLFHIRLDNSLRMLIETKNRKMQREDGMYAQITFKEDKFNENMELFTDVDKLLTAYGRIIRICCKKQRKDLGEHPEIELAFYEENGKTLFTVHHKNSIYGKPPSSASRIGDDLGLLVNRNINGICNLYIEADFGSEQYFRVDLWSPTGGRRQKIDKVSGVKYILEF